MQCIKCGDDLPEQAGAGRPRKFCSETCKRTMMMEIRRLDSRIAKLERDESTWRCKNYQVYADNAVKEIKRLEARLVELVAAAGDGSADV